MNSALWKYVLPVPTFLLTISAYHTLEQKYLFKPSYWNQCLKMTAVQAEKVVAPALFVNHGGGPLPLLNDRVHKPLTQFLQNEVKNYVDFKQIKAIILVTAHWEENVVTISGGDRHELYFDYYGFPDVSYTYKYNAPGHPELAKRLVEKFKEQGIESKIDLKRGWDHGVFVPMILIRPEADIPIVQVSVLRSQDPEKHWRLGQALKDFRKEGIAIFGSGMSYHNMRNFMSRGSIENRTVNDDFDDFLYKACLSGEEERRKMLVDWEKQKGSYEAHPRGAAEHFMPLIVIAGAGGQTRGERIMAINYSDKFKLSSFIWRD